MSFSPSSEDYNAQQQLLAVKADAGWIFPPFFLVFVYLQASWANDFNYATFKHLLPALCVVTQ